MTHRSVAWLRAAMLLGFASLRAFGVPLGRASPRRVLWHEPLSAVGGSGSWSGDGLTLDCGSGLHMSDDYGDGWNGNEARIYSCSGVLLSAGSTLLSGSSGTVEICGLDGAGWGGYTVQVGDGNYQSEVSWELFVDGARVLSGGASGSGASAGVWTTCPGGVSGLSSDEALPPPAPPPQQEPQQPPRLSSHCSGRLGTPDGCVYTGYYCGSSTRRYPEYCSEQVYGHAGDECWEDSCWRLPPRVPVPGWPGLQTGLLDDYTTGEDLMFIFFAIIVVCQGLGLWVAIWNWAKDKSRKDWALFLITLWVAQLLWVHRASWTLTCFLLLLESLVAILATGLLCYVRARMGLDRPNRTPAQKQRNHWEFLGLQAMMLTLLVMGCHAVLPCYYEWLEVALLGAGAMKRESEKLATMLVWLQVVLLIIPYCGTVWNTVSQLITGASSSGQRLALVLVLGGATPLFFVLEFYYYSFMAAGATVVMLVKLLYNLKCGKFCGKKVAPALADASTTAASHSTASTAAAGTSTAASAATTTTRTTPAAVAAAVTSGLPAPAAGTRLVSLATDDPEYCTVIQCLRSSLPRATVARISRVENPELRAYYEATRTRLFHLARMAAGSSDSTSATPEPQAQQQQQQQQAEKGGTGSGVCVDGEQFYDPEAATDVTDGDGCHRQSTDATDGRSAAPLPDADPATAVAAVPEELLWHGSRGTPPQAIWADRQDGFMRQKASQGGMWGPGVYFAKQASYSRSYAHKTAAGTQQLFLASVLVGQAVRLPADSRLQHPPQRTDGSGLRYDSVTGKTGGADITVVYENGRAFPRYLVELDGDRDRFLSRQRP